MKLHLISSFRITLCAMAVMGAAAAHAQAQPASAPAPAAAAEAPQPVHKAMPKHKAPHKPMHKGSHGTYATPEQHEAAAVAGERHRGAGPSNHGAAQGNAFEHNALRRCDIFKTDDDRRACVERVRQPQISGSVEGGGLIREYTQTVQVPPPPAPAPAPMMVPPVQPVR